MLHDRYETDEAEWSIVRLATPGRVLERCLVDGLREVALTVAGEPQRRAAVDRLAFVPEVGRLCVLRVEPTTLARRGEPNGGRRERLTTLTRRLRP